MNCPWCDFQGEPRTLHAHLGQAHPDGVVFERRGESQWYRITCPVCDEGYEHVIKPRSRDPHFVKEFQNEIRLVAFDMLVNHMIGEHDGSSEGVDRR